MSRALAIVDIQNDYFPGGAYPLLEPERAAAAAAEVLAAFRASGEPVLHLKHVCAAPEAEFGGGLSAFGHEAEVEPLAAALAVCVIPAVGG